ncbi:MAG TPA: Spy/CpxP family protein refolding chaperone [Gemmatimonadales bacterium]|nr:Spy/CpxP family protein refolding chaperone [Gemmatimonadales bacterium]
MRRFAACAFLALVVAATLAAQGEPAGPGMGQRRFAPPPDHWMTIDSLSQALGLSAEQRAKITPSYTALNGVMKDAAARRQAIRQQMQGGGGGGGGGGFTPGQEPTAEQRARFDSVRAEMQGFQAEADQYYGAIRSNLTPDQQAKLDALPKPQVMRRGPMGGGRPPQ